MLISLVVFFFSEWISNYKSKRPGVEVLQRQIDQWMADYDARELQVVFLTALLVCRIVAVDCICSGRCPREMTTCLVIDFCSRKLRVQRTHSWF